MHFSHPEHPLERVNREDSYTCGGCKMEGKGTRYRCDWCNYDLHPECMFAAPTIRFQGHRCQFLRSPMPCRRAEYCYHAGGYCRSCDACGMTIKGFVYHSENMNWDFHPRCAKLNSEIREDGVTFRLKKRGPSNCLHCQRSLLEGACNNIPGWSYVSNHKGYSFHVHCIMEMAMQNSSIGDSSSGSDLSLALRRMELQPAPSRNNGSRNKWLKILQIFLKTVLAILIGDPTTILATTLAHVVIEGFFNAG